MNENYDIEILNNSTNTFSLILATKPEHDNKTTYILKDRSNVFYQNFKDHKRFNKYYPYELYLSYYAMFLIILGTICNIFTFLIMNTKTLKKFTCMRILAALSLSDLVVLYQWNFNTFYEYNLSSPPTYKDIEELSLFGCRLLSYLAFSSLQTSAWLLSLVSLDRVMVVYSSWWKVNMTKSKRIDSLIVSIIIFIFSINFHILFLNGYIEFDSKTNMENVICYRNKHLKNYINPNWQRVHLLFYNAIPFTIMSVCNFLIIYNVKYKNKIRLNSKKSFRKKRRITFTLVLVTFSFIVLTLPSCILHTFYKDYFKDKPYKRLVYIIVNNLLHTSHAINFFLYVFSAPNFRAAFLSLFYGCQRKMDIERQNFQIQKRNRNVLKRQKCIRESNQSY
jgi:hypothetical protein